MKNSCLGLAAVFSSWKARFVRSDGPASYSRVLPFYRHRKYYRSKNEICEQTDYEPHQEQIDQVDQDKERPLQILPIIELTQASE